MNSEEVLAAMRLGAKLHSEIQPDGSRSFWLNATSLPIRSNVGSRVIGFSEVKTAGDSFFDAVPAQTFFVEVEK